MSPEEHEMARAIAAEMHRLGHRTPPVAAPQAPERKWWPFRPDDPDADIKARVEKSVRDGKISPERAEYFVQKLCDRRDADICMAQLGKRALREIEAKRQNSRLSWYDRFHRLW